MPLRMRAICLLTLAFALGTGASAAHAARGMEVAVQVDSVLMGLYGSPPKTLKLMSQLHATRIRMNVNWRYVVGKAATKRKAPKRITYNWSGYDAAARAA